MFGLTDIVKRNLGLAKNATAADVDAAYNKKKNEEMQQRGRKLVESGLKPRGLFDYAAVSAYKRTLGQ